MSKIYKALEKAERERERGKERMSHPIPLAKTEEEPKREREGAGMHLWQEEAISLDHPLVSFSQPGSLAAEQFRKLRTHLLRIQPTDPLKTIMVTSATSGEGKTFVATNLAINIATHFHVHALLVDCDLRKPQLSQWFDLRDGKGLSDYLKGDGSVADILMKTEVEKLSILPGGSIQNNPTELIASKKMEALVQELETRYRDRFVIFDTTPILATSEPEVLAKLVDGIIIVVRAGFTPRETIKQAISSFDKEKILGFVLNDLAFKSSELSSRYFGADGYYYKYGYGRNGSKPKHWWKGRLPLSKKPS